MNFLGTVVRFIVSAIVLMVVGWLVPQFSVGGFWSALMLAIVIAVLGWIIEGIFGKRVTPFGRGIVGFLSSALVVWLAQFVVGNMDVTIIGALLAALVIGIIDLFIPVATPYEAATAETGTKSVQYANNLLATQQGVVCLYSLLYNVMFLPRFVQITALLM